MKPKWTQKRIERLFKRYNRIYWQGRLSGYCIVLATLEESVMADVNGKRNSSKSTYTNTRPTATFAARYFMKWPMLRVRGADTRCRSSRNWSG